MDHLHCSRQSHWKKPRSEYLEDAPWKVLTIRTGSATWTNEQKLVHSVIKEAQRNGKSIPVSGWWAGISLSGIKRKVAVVSMNPVILRKALEGLIKLNIIKTFKPINVSRVNRAVADDSLLRCQCTFLLDWVPLKKLLVEFGTMPIRATILLLSKPSAKFCWSGLMIL